MFRIWVPDFICAVGPYPRKTKLAFKKKLRNVMTGRFSWVLRGGLIRKMLQYLIKQKIAVFLSHGKLYIFATWFWIRIYWIKKNASYIVFYQVLCSLLLFSQLNAEFPSPQKIYKILKNYIFSPGFDWVGWLSCWLSPRLKPRTASQIW